MTITDISDDGSGIGRSEGFIFFVKNALPGDEIRAGVMKVQKNYGFARMLEIAKPSPGRCRALCSVSDKCGGCTLQNYRYEEQLKYKYNKVKNDLIRIGGISEEEIEEKQENILDTKEIDYNKDILDNNENKSNSNLEMNLELDKDNVIVEDQEKKNQNNIEKEFSIESFTKYRKSKVKFNQNEDEDEEDSNNKEDITLTEKYQDYENLVYFLRSQLIYYFLVNKNSDDSFLD